jgi:hypothetical protein
MNTDAPVQADAAQKVIREMALTYTNLKARSALPFYQDEAAKRFIGAPALFILDQTGKIADIHEGYRVDLAQRVSQTIDRLLASQAAPPK